MKLVAKCSASVSLSYQVHVKACNPILLNTLQLLGEFKHSDILSQF